MLFAFKVLAILQEVGGWSWVRQRFVQHTGGPEMSLKIFYFILFFCLVSSFRNESTACLNHPLWAPECPIDFFFHSHFKKL